jgi:hypothetical protein
MPSDDRLVFVASAEDVAGPARALAASLAKGKPAAPAPDDALRKAVEAADTRQVLWAASVVTPEQKALPVVEAFDTIALVGERQGRTLALTLTGRGSDAAQVTAAANAIQKHAADSAEFISGIQGTAAFRLAVELLRSVKADAEGATATVTAKLETTPAAIVSLQFLWDESADAGPDTPAHPRLQQP